MARLKIKRYKAAVTVAHGASITLATAAVSSDDYALNGILRQVLIQTPANVDGSATVTVSIVDTDGFTVYTGTAHAANAKFVETPTTPIPLAKVATINTTYSANQTTTDSTTNVALLVEMG